MNATQRTDLTTKLAAELRRFFRELGLALAVLMMMGQTFPAVAGDSGFTGVVCSETGVSFAQQRVAHHGGIPRSPCKHCVVCLSVTGGSAGLEAKPVAPLFNLRGHELLPVTHNDLVVEYLAYLLPVSRGPPSIKIAEPMLEVMLVTAQKSPKTAFSTPESISWH